MAVNMANHGGFTVNLSADSPGEADRLAELEIGPVATLVPSDAPERLETPEGRRIIVCPAQTRDGITCEKCQLCARPDRPVIIGFYPHGSSARRAERIAGGGK
jgi:hypothetical protein